MGVINSLNKQYCLEGSTGQLWLHTPHNKSYEINMPKLYHLNLYEYIQYLPPSLKEL